MIPTPFMPSFPCFSVFTNECHGPYLIETPSGDIALLVLTDDDLLRRFREQFGVAGPTIRFDMAEQLALYLDGLTQDVTAIAFDPRVGGKAAVIVSKKKLYAELLRDD